MFITKMSLPRRTFLRGVGATVALPLLDAMVPAFTAMAKTAAHAAARASARLRSARRDHGPVDARDGRARLRVHADPEAARAVQGLSWSSSATCARPGGRRRTRTSRPRAAWLSGAIAEADRGRGRPAGHRRSIRSSRKQIGQDTPFPSIEVATEDFTGLHRRVRAGLQLRLHEHDSLASPTTPLPMEINPRVVFERLFGAAGTQRAALARMQEDRSILDSIRAGRDGPAARARRPRPRPPRATISTTSARSSGASSAPRSRTARR